jgi:predicted dinucleotide-binding enzyme
MRRRPPVRGILRIVVCSSGRRGMKIGVLGTGVVGTTIATKLVELGHEVMLGSRTPDNQKAAAWVAATGSRATQGTFADAGAFGEIVFNCTAGTGSLDALRSVARQDLSDKVLVDVSNSLDFSQGMPPSLFVPSTDSLGERIQRELPEARVVKTLNTVNANVMVDPGRVGTDHDVFVCGNDPNAKAQLSELLQAFGWPSEHVVDLGDISASRGVEAYLLLWLRVRSTRGTSEFNIRVVG